MKVVRAFFGKYEKETTQSVHIFLYKLNRSPRFKRTPCLFVAYLSTSLEYTKTLSDAASVDAFCNYCDQESPSVTHNLAKQTLAGLGWNDWKKNLLSSYSTFRLLGASWSLVSSFAKNVQVCVSCRFYFVIEDLKTLLRLTLNLETTRYADAQYWKWLCSNYPFTGSYVIILLCIRPDVKLFPTAASTNKKLLKR